MKKSLLVFQIMFCIGGAIWCRAQGTTFTYQGRLSENGSAYSGAAEFRATLWDVLSGGTSPLATNSPPTATVPVTNGVFFLPLDFGASFPGAARWLQLEVRTAAGSFTLLSPRQQVTPAPYAITAANLTGTLPATQLSGIIPNTQLSATVSLLGPSIASAEIADGTIVNADISPAAAIADTKLATIATTGKVANSALSSSVSLLGPTIDSQEIANGTIDVVDVKTNTFWQTTGNSGTTAGTHFLGTTDDAPLELKVAGVRALRIEWARFGVTGFGDTPNIIAGSPDNIVSNGFAGAVIAGGGSSDQPNRVGAHFGAVVGGLGNRATGFGSTAMGFYNVASGEGSTATGNYSEATGAASTAMGYGNIARGDTSTALGRYTVAAGAYSTAMGAQARAFHDSSFVWADKIGQGSDSTAEGQFTVKAGGGIRLVGNVQVGWAHGDYRQLQIGGGNSSGYLYGSFARFGDGVHLGYNYYADAGGAHRVIIPAGGTSRISAGYSYIGLGVGEAGVPPLNDQLVVLPGSVTVNGTFNNNSDRNAKQDLEPINPAEILDKVLRLPLQEWSYKTDASTRHLGPMAQDFHSTFNLGSDDKHIAPIDEAGVALAAIQGLNQKLSDELKRQAAENSDLKRKSAEMEARLATLETLLANLTRDTVSSRNTPQ